jgi:hypothetical protein
MSWHSRRREAMVYEYSVNTAVNTGQTTVIRIERWPAFYCSRGYLRRRF